MPLALAASLAGLLIDGIYTGAVAIAQMFRGYLVTAVVVVPSLAVASRLDRRGSIRAQLVTTSLLAYVVYTYAYYLFGTGSTTCSSCTRPSSPPSWSRSC